MTHVGDHGDARCGDGGQFLDFTGVIHADLDHSGARIEGHPQQRQRNADVIVEVAGGAAHFHGRRKQVGHNFFGGGLAGAAGDCDHIAGPAPPGPGSQPLQSAERIGNNQDGPALGRTVGNGGGGALRKRFADERSAVVIGTG